LNCKPGEPGEGEDVTAEVTIFREAVGFRAHAEYRNGARADIPLDTDNLQGARWRASRHMGKLGYTGVSAQWRTDAEAVAGAPVATRLFRRAATA
jgi:hypothetical protein